MNERAHCSLPTLDLTLSDVLEETVTASGKWYEIGLRLGVSDWKLDCIRSEQLKLTERLRETLKAWLQQGKTESTWMTLVEALRSKTVEEYQLADALNHRYCQSAKNSQGKCSYAHHRVATTGINVFATLYIINNYLYRELRHCIRKLSHAPTWYTEGLGQCRV